MDKMYLRIMWMKVIAFFLLMITMGFILQDLYQFG